VLPSMPKGEIFVKLIFIDVKSRSSLECWVCVILFSQVAVFSLHQACRGV
jgi:hypothetical protein